MTEEPTTAPDVCRLCGSTLAGASDATLVVAGVAIRGALNPSDARKLDGECRLGECARERTIARDPDGNFAHDRVAPATTLAFVGAPRRPRLAR